MTTNSVLRLRERELAKSTRTFRARGSRVIRCESCFLPKADCICSAKPTPGGQSAFCFIFYTGEVYKPSNTGRLVADVVADNYAFLWDRTRPDPELLALLHNVKYAPILLFPHEYAAEERHIQHIDQVPSIANDRVPLFIMLDGTWREAKKMFKSPSLATLPVLSIPISKPSSYRLRDGAHPHQLCTAEVAIEALKLADDTETATALTDYFDVFCQSYSVIKPHILDKER